jgi:DNA transposition AAA+ family ATPase
VAPTDYDPDTEDALQRLRIVGSRRRAEAIRLEAVELARRYRKLAVRQRLDPEVVQDDAQAVIKAWKQAAR